MNTHTSQQAIAIDQQLKKLERETRIAKWQAGGLLYALQQRDPITGLFFFQLADPSCTSWGDYCNDPDRPSRTSAFRYITLHRIYTVGYGIMPDSRVLDCAIERLVEAASLATSYDMAQTIITQASTLSEADWRLWLLEQRGKPVLGNGNKGAIQIDSAENLRRLGFDCGDATNETAMIVVIKPYNGVFSKPLKELACNVLQNAKNGIVAPDSVEFLEYWLSSLIGE